MVGKPENDKAMSSTERSRLYRQRKKEVGSKEINLTFSANMTDKIDELVEFFDLDNRSVAIKELLDLPMLAGLESMRGFKEAPEYTELSQLEGEVADAWLRIRKLAWQAICSQDKEVREDLVKTLQITIDAE